MVNQTDRPSIGLTSASPNTSSTNTLSSSQAPGMPTRHHRMPPQSKPTLPASSLTTPTSRPTKATLPMRKSTPAPSGERRRNNPSTQLSQQRPTTRTGTGRIRSRVQQADHAIIQHRASDPGGKWCQCRNNVLTSPPRSHQHSTHRSKPHARIHIRNNPRRAPSQDSPSIRQPFHFRSLTPSAPRTTM